MPQDPSLINKSFQAILQENSSRIKESGDDASLSKDRLLEEMQTSVHTLRKTNRITADQAQWAEEAMTFYKEHTNLLPWDKNPNNLLSELAAVDYSKKVSIVRVKEGRVMTQMQHPDDSKHDLDTGKFSPEAVGSFYAEGVLPSDFEQRADKSGIGIKSDRAVASNPKRAQEDKSVYQFKVSKTSVFLRSVASKADDVWSAKDTVQQSKGGGVQWRISTRDYSNMERQVYGELERRNAVSKETPLKKGMRINIDNLVSSVTKNVEVSRGRKSTPKYGKKKKESKKRER